MFDFNDYNSKAEVQNAIHAARYEPGETDTDQALDYAATTLYTPANGARPASAKVTLVGGGGGCAVSYTHLTLPTRR